MHWYTFGEYICGNAWMSFVQCKASPFRTFLIYFGAGVDLFIPSHLLWLAGCSISPTASSNPSSLPKKKVQSLSHICAYIATAVKKKLPDFPSSRVSPPFPPPFPCEPSPKNLSRARPLSCFKERLLLLVFLHPLSPPWVFSLPLGCVLVVYLAGI